MEYRIWWKTMSKATHDTHFSESFYYPVKDVSEAKFALNLLAQYDLRSGSLVSDNVSGFEFRHSEFDEWIEFEDSNGDDIWELINNA